MEWRSVSFKKDAGCAVCGPNGSGRSGEYLRRLCRRSRICNWCLPSKLASSGRLNSPRGIADQRRGQIQQQLVDQAFPQQRTIQLEAGLGVNFIHAAAASSRSSAGRSTLPASFGRKTTSAPVDRSTCAIFARHRRRRHRPAPARPAGCGRPSGVSRWLSTTTRKGWRDRFDLAHIELRIIVAHGADAGQDGTGAGAPAMAVTPGIGAGDPLADAIVQCCLAVQAGRRLQAQPGAPRVMRETKPMLSSRASFSSSHWRCDAGFAQAGEPLARRPADWGRSMAATTRVTPAAIRLRRRAACGRNGCRAPA
jgi:hypothetical protein